jgi:putative phosphoesterase
MRLAAVSDIHGNLPALEAVLADIERRNVDLVVNLGDSLSGPLWPVETAERLMALGWPTLAGNHERQLLTLPRERMGETDEATAALLTERIREWLASLPSTVEIAEDLLLCHGAPTCDRTYWLHRGRRGSMREASAAEIAEHATAHALTLCGHTHLPRAARLGDGRQVANPGSVGLPAYEDDLPAYHAVETGTPHARYLTAERAEGRWRVELHAVSYNFEVSARKAEAAARPTWAHALRTGRVMPPRAA